MTFATTLALALLAFPAPSGNAPILLDFHADWCGPCQQMRPAVEKLVDKGYPVKSVDIDRSPKLAQRYQVEQVPTFVVVAPDGRELGRVSGARPAAELAELYNNAKTRLGRARPAPAEEDVEARDEADAPAGGDDEDEPESAGPDSAPRNPGPWETVVRIKVLQGGRSIGFGSGTIIRSTPDETIILTCAHIFKIDGARTQPTPAKFPYPIRIDLFDGVPRSLGKTKPAIVHAEEKDVPGQAIDYDFNTDVGLIRIRPGRKLPASPVVPAGWSARRGMALNTAGCSEGHDATIWTTHVSTPLFRGLVGKANYEAIECSDPPKQGRSGGGLFTPDGYVAGVCDFAEPRGGHGLYASPRSIHRMLDKNNLAVCYNPAAASKGLLAARDRRKADADKTTLRAQNDPIPAARRRISIPEPELVGARLDDAGATRRTARKEPDPAPPDAHWQAPSRTTRLASTREEPDDEALPTDHQMSPAAAGEPDASPAEEPDQPADAPAPETRPAPPINGGWKAPHRR